MFCSGILVCMECSGVHRRMGTHISKVRSQTLDKWEPELLYAMQEVGNATSNSLYEAGAGERPARFSSREEREEWIRAKYEAKLYLAPLAPECSPIAAPRMRTTLPLVGLPASAAREKESAPPPLVRDSSRDSFTPPASPPSGEERPPSLPDTPSNCTLPSPDGAPLPALPEGAGEDCEEVRFASLPALREREEEEDQAEESGDEGENSIGTYNRRLLSLRSILSTLFLLARQCILRLTHSLL